jgi:hypothetical protein
MNYETTKVRYKLKGICPIKFDRYVEGPQPKNDDGWRKQADKKVYRDKKGFIAIPAVAIKACMRNGASDVGKKMEAKKNRETIRCGVFFEQDMLSVGKKEPDCIAEDIVTRGKGEKVTRVKTYRPLIEKWEVEGTMTLFGCPHEFANESLFVGGLRKGLLSHRPEFGRFEVVEFELIKNAK